MTNKYVLNNRKRGFLTNPSLAFTVATLLLLIGCAENTPESEITPTEDISDNGDTDEQVPSPDTSLDTTPQAEEFSHALPRPPLGCESLHLHIQEAKQRSMGCFWFAQETLRLSILEQKKQGGTPPQ